MLYSRVSGSSLQVELFTHCFCVQNVVQRLQKEDIRLAAVHLVDAYYCRYEDKNHFCWHHLSDACYLHRVQMERKATPECSQTFETNLYYCTPAYPLLHRTFRGRAFHRHDSTNIAIFGARMPDSAEGNDWIPVKCEAWPCSNRGQTQLEINNICFHWLMELIIPNFRIPARSSSAVTLHFLSLLLCCRLWWCSALSCRMSTCSRRCV